MTNPFLTYRESAQVLAPRAQLWKLPLGVIIAFLGQALVTPVILVPVALAVSVFGGVKFAPVLDEFTNMGGPGALIVILATFIGLVLGISVAMRFLHRRDPRLLLSWSGRFDRDGFVVATLVFGGVGIAAVIVSLPFQDYVANMPPGRWALWLVPALAVTFVQVFAEEMVFRGYLQGNLAARYSSPVIWLGVPALAFGAMHVPNAAAFGNNWWLVVLAPTLIGLIAGHLTVRTGGIGAATGLHFANNCLGLLVVAVPGPFGELALFQHPIELGDAATVRPMILTNLAVILLAYGIYLAVTRPRAAPIA